MAGGEGGGGDAGGGDGGDGGEGGYTMPEGLGPRHTTFKMFASLNTCHPLDETPVIGIANLSGLAKTPH